MDYKNLTCSFPEKLGCWIAIRLAKFIPVLLVGSIVGYAYYSYIFQICFYTITCPLERTIYVSLFHVILFLFLCSYYRTVFAETKKVPNLFKLPEDIKFQVKTASNEQEKLLAILKHGLSLPVKTRTFIGGMLTVRYCPHCEHIKPDRTHHCRICSTCVLKMDHHCPWINNCVSFSNYKYFMLFLFYALLFCVYIMITSFPYFLQAWQNYVMAEGKIHIVFLFVIAAMFSISMLSIFTYHIYLISKNTTTLEACRTPIFVDGISHKTPYSRGFLSNLKEVFGSNAFLWFLPVFTSKGDGVQFRVVGEEDSLCGSTADNPLLHV